MGLSIDSFNSPPFSDCGYTAYFPADDIPGHHFIAAYLNAAYFPACLFLSGLFFTGTFFPALFTPGIDWRVTSIVCCSGYQKQYIPGYHTQYARSI